MGNLNSLLNVSLYCFLLILSFIFFIFFFVIVIELICGFWEGWKLVCLLSKCGVVIVFDYDFFLYFGCKLIMKLVLEEFVVKFS